MKPLRVRVGTRVYVRVAAPSTPETAQLLLTLSPRYEQHLSATVGGAWRLVRPLLTQGPHTITIKWRGRQSRHEAAVTPPAYGLDVTYEPAHDTYAVRAWFHGPDGNIREQHEYTDIQLATLAEPKTMLSWIKRVR